jgi:DNA polymerase sigma
VKYLAILASVRSVSYNDFLEVLWKTRFGKILTELTLAFISSVFFSFDACTIFALVFNKMATTHNFGDLHMSSESSTRSSLIISSSNSNSVDSNRSASVDGLYATRTEREQLIELSRELQSFISRVTPSVDDTMSHNVVLDLVRDVARRVLDPSADIQMFGSAASGLCERGSDIDATVIVDFAILNKRFHGKNRTPSVGHETRTLCSEAVCAIAKYIESTNGTGLGVEGLINGAKVPIVVLSSFGRQIIDVSINNVLPTFNTRLLGEYSKLDSRVISLVLSVKRWAKMAQVSDAKMGNLSSYSWSILCLYYLQYVGIIPSLQSRAPPGLDLYHCPSTGKSFDVTFLSGPAAQAEKRLLPPKDDLTVAELLCGFFTFYDKEFKWGTEVVSIRIGGKERKSINEAEFGMLSQGSRSMMELPTGTERIHIEDPFDLTRNLHCVMDTEGLIRLRKAFRDISSKLSGAPVSVLQSLAKTLMSYKNVVPAFATAELNKRYNGVGVRGSPSSLASGATMSNPAPTPAVRQTGLTIPSGQLDDERAAAIVRNYARQQEILEKQLLNLQQRPATVVKPQVVAPPPRQMSSKQIGQPGRGSYRQATVTASGAPENWTTVDLW